LGRSTFARGLSRRTCTEHPISESDSRDTEGASSAYPSGELRERATKTGVIEQVRRGDGQQIDSWIESPRKALQNTHADGKQRQVGLHLDVVAAHDLRRMRRAEHEGNQGLEKGRTKGEGLEYYSEHVGHGTAQLPLVVRNRKHFLECLEHIL
jgi:hypothetical protein